MTKCKFPNSNCLCQSTVQVLWNGSRTTVAQEQFLFTVPVLWMVHRKHNSKPQFTYCLFTCGFFLLMTLAFSNHNCLSLSLARQKAWYSSIVSGRWVACATSVIAYAVELLPPHQSPQNVIRSWQTCILILICKCQWHIDFKFYSNNYYLLYNK